MKRGCIISILIILILPLVQAVPGAPYSILSEDGSWIPVAIDSEGKVTKPIYEKDEEKFNNPDEELGEKIFEQQGDHDYSELYEKETQCPVVIQKDATGRRRPYIAKIDENGYFKPDTNLPLRRDQRIEELQKQGAVCGKENIRLIRPRRPPALVKPIYEMYNPERQVINTEYGYGIKTQPDGTYTYYDPYLQEQQQQGELPPPPKTEPKPIILFTGQAVYDISYEAKELPIVIIPIQFTDTKATISTSELEAMFFGEKSLASYFKEQSYGALKLSGTVLPTWYTLANTMEYYGDNNEANVEEMILEAIEAADKDIDFSQYDANDDGVVDSLFVVHAGDPDENGGGNNEEIWSHYFSINPITVDGVQIIDYETVSETSPVGIIAHEFGHYLGLPDMYDTVPDDGTSKGTAEWSIMGYGGYMKEPGSFDPWSKAYLSWLNKNSYQEIETNNYFTIVQDSASTGIRYYAVPISESEIFFIENRHTAELMNGDEAGGVVIWHVDESVMTETGSWNGCSGTKWDCNTVNGEAEHKLIDIEEADGKDNIDKGDLGEAEDLWFNSCGSFSGCRQNEFSLESNPPSTSYDETKKIYIGVYSDIAGTMELGVTVDGTTLAAPETEKTIAAPEEKGSFLTIIIISIISLILIAGGTFLALKIFKKKENQSF
ncbi:MAG TPA: M6 family metalloprotease domain-containing protein [Nanoarchaeota archaeon]|nr:M6 family metalloprotease domain-containing protein [Candidatus Woesearchaeota archaeon]HIH14678.1 M6 family metalloprotease domain-containing protein [Nanoarchaeota archaeon]HIH58700.1 M6 family metalloprotease domain-containing protein [Nanoarchaeota archaeon]HII14327.1 M6 family metalloprotease domain-containing protein [Nanoarchaeota archaeon]HIJ04889.1 M6 family metalloprotease domain-containing protein [Nanoarchaeota archaeon]